MKNVEGWATRWRNVSSKEEEEKLLIELRQTAWTHYELIILFATFSSGFDDRVSKVLEEKNPEKPIQFTDIDVAYQDDVTGPWIRNYQSLLRAKRARRP